MPLNMQLVRKRRQAIAKQEEERKKGKHFDQLNPGDNKRRVMPPWVGSEDWRKFAAYHFGVLEKESVLCPKKTFNKPCPICEYNEELFKSDSEDDKKEAKRIRAKDRFFCNVLNLDKNDSKVYILSFGQTVEEQIINIMDPGGNDENSADEFGVGDITSPETGRTLLIKKEVPADPTQTSYTVQAANNPSAVPNWEAVSQQIHNLDEFVAADEYTYEEMVGMLDGTFKGAAEAPAPSVETKSAAPKEEFGAPAAKKEEPKTVTETFEAPKSIAPQVQKPVESTQPPSTMSAIDRLKARKGNK